MTKPMQVAIIGGGVAGLSAAEALRREGIATTLYEAKSRLGGRAGSFLDKPSGRWIDLCQHIGMGCCSEWIEFCGRSGVDNHLRRDRVLHFVGTGSQRYRFQATDWLPPPLHLTRALWGMGFLSWSERLHLVSTLRRLQSLPTDDLPDMPSIGQWLAERGVSARALRRFYEPVLISALGESLEHASLSMSRKIFVDGFLTTRDGFHLLTPTCSLTELYDRHVASYLQAAGVQIQRSTPVKRIIGSRAGVEGVEVEGAPRRFDAVIMAVPWSRVETLVEPELQGQLPWMPALKQIEAAPITGVHLWFDRRLMDMPHAAILDRLSQWIFAAPGERTSAEVEAGEYYHQVIISASHALRERATADVIAEVVADLQAVLPPAAEAQLLRARVVTEQAAVFSVRPGVSQLRPTQRTGVPGLYIAGDWTDTQWPATMESAVRSGQLAASALVKEVTT